jgi:hypothetical protein
LVYIKAEMGQGAGAKKSNHSTGKGEKEEKENREK